MEIHIKHKTTSFLKRILIWVFSFVVILSIFFLYQYVFRNDENRFVYFGYFILLLLPFFIIQIWKEKLYITAFSSDSKIVRISYYNWMKQLTKETFLLHVKVLLINATTRSGFDCELHLLIDDTKFIINDKNDWSLEDMKLLFEYIKTAKNEKYSEIDMFNISKIEEKIKIKNI